MFDALVVASFDAKGIAPTAVADDGRATWHQFRHIHSSLLSDLKVPVQIAQEQLGHASIAITLNIYTHVVDASHRKAIEAVEERLFGEMDCFGLKSSTAVDQPESASAFVH